MSTRRKPAETARLLRCRIQVDELLAQSQIWTLDFPHYSAVKAFQKSAYHQVKDQVSGEYIGIPLRELNSALMAVAPTLAHGFENGGYALAVGTPNVPACCPEPAAIQHVLRAWARQWSERSYLVKNMHMEERISLRDQLLDAIDNASPEWEWVSRKPRTLLTPFKPKEALNYDALPSLMAAFLHDKTSIIAGQEVHWRKVQDSSSKKLSIVSQPLWGSFHYRPSRARQDKQGSGYFAYKIEFSLQTQAGHQEPWLFVSFHVQRYGHEPLASSNEGRLVSVLTGANQARLDGFPTDHSLVNLQMKAIAENSYAWVDHLPTLLAEIGVTTPLADPNEICAAPRAFWRSDGATIPYERDEYYVVHTEGYRYSSGKGHELATGLSLTNMNTLMEEVLGEHLTMLKPDSWLQPDKISFPTPAKLPLALRNYDYWAKQPNLKSKNWGTEETRQLERAERFSSQRSAYQAIMTERIHRTLGQGEEMLVAVLWHNEPTREGLYMALREAFLLNPGDEFPINVTIVDQHVPANLLDALETTSTIKYRDAHCQRVREWQTFLHDNLQEHLHCFAIVEVLHSSWGVKGTVRQACASEGITSQVVRPIRLKENSETQSLNYLGGPGQHEHRANSVAREVSLRHLGILHGTTQGIYESAGIVDASNLEVLALYMLNKPSRNIRFPIAAKLTASGTVKVQLPDRNEWVPYHHAATAVGNHFASAWRFNHFEGGQRKIRYESRENSQLYYNEAKLNGFLRNVLKNLEYPTLALIEGNVWPNWNVWPQLRNTDLIDNRDTLNFAPHERTYSRKDPQMDNLLAVIRLRAGEATPQYVTKNLRDFGKPTGLLDKSVAGLLHYFSIGQLSITANAQDETALYQAMMTDSFGSGVAYKHPQAVEMVPFFVRQDYDSEIGQTALCRIAHFLRLNPAWSHGNTVYPYPMHLAQQLLEDQLSILAMED